MILYLQTTNYKLQTNRGQGIIEILIAVSLITGGFLAGVVIFSNVFKTHQIMAEKITAAYLGVEGIEIVKNIIDISVKNSGNFPSISDGDYEVDIDKTDVNQFVSIPSGAPLNYLYLHNDSLSGINGRFFYNYDNSNFDSVKTSFTRKITIDNSIPDKIKVTSEVNWKTREKDEGPIKIEAVFYNWRQ